MTPPNRSFARNAWVHAGTTVAYREYSPGLGTAIALFPATWVALTAAAVREGRITRRAAALSALAGAAVHAAAFAVAGVRRRRGSVETVTPGRDEPEVALSGGNMTAVVRVGETVRRAAGPWTPTIHAFMRHLRASGFVRIPEPLGLDDRGREIISLLPGAPATYPLPDFACSDATLASVAQALRAFHDASVGFAPLPDGRWRRPAREPAEVVCHNDFAPYNLLFERGRLTGVIDLDLASPGPRVRDMGYCACLQIYECDVAYLERHRTRLAGTRR